MMHSPWPLARLIEEEETTEGNEDEDNGKEGEGGKSSGDGTETSVGTASDAVAAARRLGHRAD